MRSITTTGIAALALTATLGLSACQDTAPSTQRAESPASTSTSQGSPDAAPSDETSPTTAPSASEAPSSEGPTSNGAPAQDAPASGREDKGDATAIDAAIESIPPGPASGIRIAKLGGYTEKSGDEYGTFYAVLRVDSGTTGLMSLEFVMRDSQGRELKSVSESIDVGGSKNELKVVRATGKLPNPAQGKVAKVSLRVKTNNANEFATVTHIDPKIQWRTDAATATPVVYGFYKTQGKGSVISVNAICSDAQGRVVSESDVLPQMKAKDWTAYEIDLRSAPDGYRPQRCYVGS